MCNETAGNSINADEIQNEQSPFDFRIWENKNCQPTKNICDRKGG